MTDALKKLTTAIASLTSYIGKCVISEIHRKALYKEEPQRFLYTLLFKTNNGLDTVNLLISNLYSKSHFIDSAFIILRTILSDCVIYDYILTLSKSDEDLKANISGLYFDHIRHDLKHLKTNKVLFPTCILEIESEIARLKHLKSEYFDSSGNEIYPKIFPSVSTAINKINESKSTEISIQYPIIARNLYNKFSKYEHLGHDTFEYIHKQYTDQERNEILFEVYESIAIITQYMSSFILAWESYKFVDFKEFEIVQKSVLNSIK